MKTDGNRLKRGEVSAVNYANIVALRKALRPTFKIIKAKVPGFVLLVGGGGGTMRISYAEVARKVQALGVEPPPLGRRRLQIRPPCRSAS